MLSLAQFSTTAIAGQTQTNLNVIAAVVIGGTSLFGGVGTIFGTVVGLFIPAVLQNGFVIVGIQPFWQQVAVGAVLIAAVYVDQIRRAAAQRGGSSPLLRLRSHEQPPPGARSNIMKVTTTDRPRTGIGAAALSRCPRWQRAAPPRTTRRRQRLSGRES